MSMQHNTGMEGEGRAMFHVSPSMVHSAFLTPPSPYHLEARRDSVASLPSSMSSFSSCVSDYPDPVTPVCVPSPITKDRFRDMAYELHPDFLGRAMHASPLPQPPKNLISDNGFYGSWEAIQPNPAFMEDQPLDFQPHLLLPGMGGMMPPQVTEHPELEPAIVPNIGPSWETFPATVISDMGQEWVDSHLVPHAHEDSLQEFWLGHVHQSQDNSMPQSEHRAMHQSQEAPSQTIDPSAAMVDAERDYAHTEPESFTDSNSFRHSTPSFVPSPQEVSFKSEISPSVKHEADEMNLSPSSSRYIYVSPTGGKSVKKERRVSKRSCRVNKKKSHNQILRGEYVHGELDGVACKLDEKNGKYEWYATRPRQTKKECGFLDENGHRCRKSFLRAEHLKRHQETTHSPGRIFFCSVCNRPFNRNDNCQEHHWTHVRKPGKKQKESNRWSLEEVVQCCTDPINGPKLIEKLRQKWKTYMLKEGKMEEDISPVAD